MKKYTAHAGHPRRRKATDTDRSGKRKPKARRVPKKRKNPAFGNPDVFLNSPAMQDFIGNALLAIAMERLGIRGRDVLSAVSAVFAPATSLENPLGPETPERPQQPEESSLNVSPASNAISFNKKEESNS